MCKVLCIPKINDENRADAWVFAQLLGELMALGNKDGLGYAGCDKDGNIFGEKWLHPDIAFKDLTQIHGINSSKLEKIYSYFGDKVVKDETQAILLHTRAATCGGGIENAHPFINDTDKPEVAIIHNGMIYNDFDFKRKYSTCDSEVLAHLYHEHKVSTDLSKLNEFSEKLQGWFTVLALSKDKDNRMVIDAFSDNGRLGSYFVKELNTRVYSTYADDIFRVAKGLGWTVSDPQTMKSDTAFRIDVATGEEIQHVKLVSHKVQVRVYPASQYWGPSANNVTVMEGNLSDEEFRQRFWRGYGGDW
jgi:hypothetical protein